MIVCDTLVFVVDKADDLVTTEPVFSDYKVFAFDRWKDFSFLLV